MKAFASDNYSGVCPEIMQAIIDANNEHAPAYGGDKYTEKAIQLAKEHFGNTAIPYFVFNGTAANVLILKAMTRSHHAVICAETSHIAAQEVGAAVSLTGVMLITTTETNGKITPSTIEDAHANVVRWGCHANKPRVVSIAQSTEYGTVYTIEEIQAISATCKKLDLLLHMDGCRLANAAVSLNCSLKNLTADVGVDALSFGGTKNGLLFGEMIIFFREDIAQEFEYIQKQGLQLASKMRFLSAQFIPYFEQAIWHKNASHSNNMCIRLAEGLKNNPSIRLAHPVQTNQLFAHFTPELIKATSAISPYYVWDENTHLVRLITSFDTTEEEVDSFIYATRL
ncbi:MAG: beta-eliminating lyase [Gammaproteobacteria bacterium]|nr:beta-eliminating lyase [Gammaproteobacteria bacterium]